MNWRKQIAASWRSALAGAVLCATLGLALLHWGHGLVFLSYDLLFWFRTAPPMEAVIVYMDDRSFNELKQSDTPQWDRNLHARLLDRLTGDGAKLVVFDVVFDQAGEPSANTNFARAMRQNGRVVLAAALDTLTRPQALVRNAVLPLPEFEQAAAGWGITEMMSPVKAVARQYFVGTETQPSLPWRAARLWRAGSAEDPAAAEPESWLNFYGPALTLRHFSYCDVFSQPAEVFRDQAVFVGAQPKTLKAGDEADTFRTPHTLWNQQHMPGVELTATAFLNFIRNDGLAFGSWPKQLLLVLAAGLLLGGALALVRPLPGIGLAVAGAGGLFLAALAAAQQHVWFAWTVPAFAQIPAALAWSLRCHFHRLKFEKEVLERTLTETSRRADEAAARARPSGFAIPDHTLERLVGRGAYGDVYLARNAVGVFHAVKIVRRRDFPGDAPYEREFRGIQKFMPISRSHVGFVNVLHVGRNDVEGCFYCIMEAADDRTAGRLIDPATYEPKTLAAVLASGGKLAPEQCIQLGLALSLALEHLHQHQLVHRDIKPGNIIYVDGAPKLADIGLVTEQAGAATVSMVGTEGYVPPEGPGTPAADVYALGKVLYEAGMGRDRLVFPEVPTAVWEQPAGSRLRRLNDVICRACDTNVKERYASAAALHAALLELQSAGH